jgi:hypothetical protein
MSTVDLPVMPEALVEPLQTTVTTNAEFMAAVFQGLNEPARPFVHGFHGKPKDQKGWSGNAVCISDMEDQNSAMNWYFTLATFKLNDGIYRRREDHCESVYGVVLDDIGTKAAPLERLAACPPSYVIETSAGNFQAAYLFAVPESDLQCVNALIESMVEANLCDPGAKSPSTRYGRLPFASNGKSDPAFSCRLIEWHPERRYTVDQIVKGLELLPPAAKTRARRKPGESAKNSDAGEVYVPRPSENPVINVLRSRGLYKRPLGDGRHDITCPWVHEHTDAADGGSAYFEPSSLFPIGGYKCQHGHCDQRHVGELLQYLDVSATEAKNKPTIRAIAGALDQVMDSAELELAKTGRYYQRGSVIVTVVSDPDSYDAVVKTLSPNTLIRVLSRLATWERLDGRTHSHVVMDPTMKLANLLCETDDYRHLPVLRGIARQPYLRPDGSLMKRTGFDPASGMYGAFDERQYEMPVVADKDSAIRALEELKRLLNGFRFAKPHDMAAAIAMILTATIRPSLPYAPMGHVKAPQIASGKSYLCNVIGAFAGPKKPTALTYPTTDEECTKLLSSILMEAPAVVMFDNLTTDLYPYRTMCSALTEENIGARILGASKMTTVGTRALFLSSGNNVDPVRDMTRRVITIALDPGCETPASRQFHSDPLGQVFADRPKFISMALTIVLAYMAAGCPDQGLKPLANYAEWTRLVRAPLSWLGLPDPAESLFGGMDTDPDRETLGRFLTAWRAKFGSAPTAIRTLAEHVDTFSQSELHEIVMEIADERGKINRRRLGKWISRHQGRIVDGLKFARAGQSGGAECWQVVSVVSLTPAGHNGDIGNDSMVVNAGGHPIPFDLVRACHEEEGDRHGLGSVGHEELVERLTARLGEEHGPGNAAKQAVARWVVGEFNTRGLLDSDGCFVKLGVLA